MIHKLLLLATSAVLVCSFHGSAFAQQLHPAGSPITAQQHSLATHGGTIHSGGSTTAQAATLSTGWYYVHATNCNSYYDGSTTWTYIYPSEGGYWFTSNPVHQNTMLTQCTLGNWIAFYVNNTNGSWNQSWTYTYK
jgi:hypothetical protein